MKANEAMRAGSYIDKIWDFIFGSIITGTLPLAVFWLVWMFTLIAMTFVKMAFPGEQLLDVFSSVTGALLFILSSAITLVVFYFVLKWRKRQRMLPAWRLGVESACGLVAGIMFLHIFFRGMAALPP